jgi:hypothetical protein
MNRITAEGFDYQGEADKTCSIEWGAHKVNRADFLGQLRVFAVTAQILNLYKKLLFRGKLPEDVGLLQPSNTASLLDFIPDADVDLVHGIVGIATEAGEAVEILIAMIEGTAPDRVNAVEEVGDLRWYMNRVLRWANVTDEECERANIAKLHGRGFAFGFNAQADSNRDLQAERAILESATLPGIVEPRTSDMSDMCDAERFANVANFGSTACGYRDPMLRLPSGVYGDEPGNG